MIVFIDFFTIFYSFDSLLRYFQIKSLNFLYLSVTTSCYYGLETHKHDGLESTLIFGVLAFFGKKSSQMNSGFSLLIDVQKF